MDMRYGLYSLHAQMRLKAERMREKAGILVIYIFVYYLHMLIAFLRLMRFDLSGTCYTDGDNMEARQALLEASFDAGVAFTRAGVGYVHAIAHQLGALYHVPHGVANAMILPYILEFYQNDMPDKFADLAIAAGLKEGNESNITLASKFTQAVRKMKEDLDIPTFVKGFPASMVDNVVERALNEAHGATFSLLEAPIQYSLDTGYPVPGYMSTEQCRAIVANFVDPSASNTSKL